MHEWEEEKECREADEVTKVLEMAMRKTREAEENTKAVEEEARKMIAAAREKAVEEAMTMERITKSEAVATRHDEWTWMTTNAAEHDERTRTTNAVAAED